MPPAGYLSSAGIEDVLEFINTLFPNFTDRFELPEPSVKGETIHGLRMRSGSDSRNGVLLIGGTHARELINPDLLVYLALRIGWAYQNNLELRFHVGPLDWLGGKRYTEREVELLLEGLDIFIVPNINPDGRTFVLDHYLSDWDWRKNRSDNADGSFGVDLNRNHDVVFDEDIGSSDIGSDYTYHGPHPYSEPETRNVRWILRQFPNIVGLLDVHSYWEAILHPWGHAYNQTDNPDMNFRNPAWDGQRDTAAYREYIPEDDLDTFIDRGRKTAAAIAAVRFRQYYVGQPRRVINQFTSDTARDYAYSRFFRGRNTKVWAYTIETNRLGDPCPDDDDCEERYGFSPPYSEARNVMEEVSAGIVRFLLSMICVVREAGRGIGPVVLGELADFRDVMLRRRRGRGWVGLLERHNDELLGIVMSNRRMRQEAEAILRDAATVVVARGDKAGRSPVISPGLAERIDRLAERVERAASDDLRAAIHRVRGDLHEIVGMTARDAIGELIEPDEYDDPARRDMGPDSAAT
jgi:murein tripeptide amidase MpaA